MRHLVLLSGFLCVLAQGCDFGPSFEAPPAERSEPPSIGAAGSTDAADRSCSVMLRSAEVPYEEDGEMRTRCESGACTWVWLGSVDAATALVNDGASVGVLYHRASDPDWWEVPATVTGPGNPGFTRYAFEISEHAFGPEEAGGEALELIPFLVLPDGSRLFDHNQNEGDAENYLVDANTSWRAWGDYYTCTRRADTAAIRFSKDFDEAVLGEIRQGGRLAVQYDLDRLPDCRNSHNGFPAWDTTAFVKFLPGGDVESGSVRAFVSHYGTPTNTPYAVPFEVEIPADATRVEIWFRNASGAGSTCETWDSNYGENYAYSIDIPRSEDPCADSETWRDRYGGDEYCPTYAVAANYDASYCEFWLDTLGDGYEGHYGIPFSWLEAYLPVGQQDGTVLAVGMYAEYFDHTDATHGVAWRFGREISPGYWQTGLTYQFTGYMGSGSYRYSVESFSFFLDVRRPSGEVVRLWQSNGGADYTLADAFTLDPYWQSIPYGHVEYANDASAIYDAERACR